MEEIVYPTLREAVQAAMVQVRETEGSVFMCRNNCGREEVGCRDCYKIDSYDRRSVDEHVAAFTRGDA